MVNQASEKFELEQSLSLFESYFVLFFFQVTLIAFELLSVSYLSFKETLFHFIGKK